MRDRSKTSVAEQSRREFLRAVGVGVPSLTVLAGGTGGAPAEAPNSADNAEKKPSREGGDLSYKHLTLEEVARTGHEVRYEEIAEPTVDPCRGRR